MENREAIEWLKGCVVSYEVDNNGRPNGNITCDLTQEVLNMAISALEKQEADRWIPVTERLPKLDEEVLVTDQYGDIWQAAYIDWCGDERFVTAEESMTLESVIAWRALPKPYTEEEP